MTVENTQNKMPPLQMGTTNEYPFNFAVLLQDPTAEEALEAIKASVLQADGTEIELVYNTDYTVTLNTDRIGGTLTVNDIRTSSDYITIYRQYAQTQEVDYKDFNSAPAETFEQCFDKLTMLSQQQQEEINRSIKLPVSSDITNLSLPNPVAGRTLKWNESETGLINSDVSIDEIDEFVKSANESAEIAVEKAEEIQGKLDEALEVADTIKDIEIIATLEIGDIGIAPLGIDETKGKRRYLNGQLIIQEQYVQFTNKVKSAIALYPSLSCTESEWQTTATMTVGGQVGKFVVDDNAGTIRLPKIIMPIQGLTDLSKLAEIVEVGLPNITGSLNSSNMNVQGYYREAQGAFVTLNTSRGTFNASENSSGFYNGLSFNASLSNSIYGNSNTVQQEQIQYPYFIQVATGAETEDNIINEIELNNPFSLLDYKYSEYELNNISWLRSNGQWNSKATHPAVYELLLKIYNGTETKAGVSVKLHTEEYTDYDFVLNTAKETFRLPIKVKLASGKAVVGNGMTVGLTDGTNYGGLFTCGENNQAYQISAGTSYYGNNLPNFNATDISSSDVFKKHTLGLTTDPTKSGLELSDSDLYLYFYVGETVQNANLINAGRIEEKVASLIPDNSSLIAGYGMPSDRYIDLTLGASGTEYTAPANGWLCFAKQASATNQRIALFNASSQSDTMLGSCIFSSSNSQGLHIFVPAKKGDRIAVIYNAAGTNIYFRFIYAKGEQ